MEIQLTEKMDSQHIDAGMATAEYAIATIAAVGFAGLLVTLLKSDVVNSALAKIITTALSVAG